MKRHHAIAVILIAVALSGCGDSPPSARSALDYETRRYLVHDILLSGGRTDEQRKLHEAYQQALEERRASGSVSAFPLFRRTFEIVDVAFPEGTSAVLSPADGHLWIRHASETLDRLEERFSIRPAGGTDPEGDAGPLSPGKPAFVPPPPERIAALLGFAAPVVLVRHIASEEELARAPKRKGTPLASYSYSDPAHTSESIAVTIYAAGAYLGARRAEFDEGMRTYSSEAGEGDPGGGIFPTADGRSIYQFPIGFGPGGSAYAALLPCRDARYELVLVQGTDFHDDEDQKAYAHHTRPAKDLKSIIESVETLVFP